LTLQKTEEAEMKKILFVIAVLCFAAGSAAAAEKIAYVDTQAVFEKTKLGQKYQGIVREYYTNRKKILDADADEIKKQQEDFKKQSGVMNEKARKEKDEAIGRKINDFEKKRSEFNDEIGKKNDELSREFDQSMSVVLKDIAKKEKISMVLNKSVTVAPKSDVPTVLYADDDLDLTAKVVTELDKKFEVSK
jgi:outer membrane protein